MILSVAAERGQRAAVIAAWAHALGIGGWALFTLYGWSEVNAYAPWIAHLLSCVGALYLIYLAAGGAREAYTLTQRAEAVDVHLNVTSPDEDQSAPRSLRSTPALLGFTISASNPKILVFFIAIYTQLLPQAPTSSDQALAALIPFVVDGAWYTFAASLAARLGILTRLEHHRATTLYVTAVLFVMIATRTLWLVWT